MNCANSYWAILAVVILGSCQVRTYVQPTPNAPLLEAKKDFRLNANVQLMDNGHNGIQLQSAYSPINNLGVHVSSYFAGSFETISLQNWDDNKFGTWHAEGGLGYYKTIGEMYFSFYAGYGKGYMNQANSFNPGILTSNLRTLASYGEYEKVYQQLSIWSLIDTLTNVGLSIRSDQNYFEQYAYLNHLRRNNGDNEQEFFEEENYYLNIITFTFLVRINSSENFAWTPYLGFSSPIQGQSFHENTLHLGFSICYQLNHGKRLQSYHDNKRKTMKIIEDFYK